MEENVLKKVVLTPIVFGTALMRIDDLPFLARNVVEVTKSVLPKLLNDFGIDNIPFVWMIVRFNAISYGDPFCIQPTLDYLKANGIDYRYYEYNLPQKFTWDPSPINEGLKTLLNEDDKRDSSIYNPFFMILDDDNILNEQMFYDYAVYNESGAKQDIIYYDMIHEGSRLWSFDKVMFEKKLTSNYYWDYVADPSQTMIRMSLMKSTNFILMMPIYRKFLNRYILQGDSYLAGFDLNKYYADMNYIMNFVAYDISYYTPLIILMFLQDNVYFTADDTKRKGLSHEMNKSISTYHNGLRILTTDGMNELNEAVTKDDAVLNASLYIDTVGDHVKSKMLKLDSSLMKQIWNIIYGYYSLKNYETEHTLAAHKFLVQEEQAKLAQQLQENAKTTTETTTETTEATKPTKKRTTKKETKKTTKK